MTTNNPPPHLYLSIFALAAIYIPPSSPLREHLPLEAPRVYADAAREFLLSHVGLIGHRLHHHQKSENVAEEDQEEGEGGGGVGGGLEAVQSAVLLAMYDWGQGQVDRAWFMSCESLSLSLRWSFSLSPTAESRNFPEAFVSRFGCCCHTS